MPVIAIANPKGGSGKSTAALILATTLAGTGASVSVIDCDPNRAIETWSKGAETSGANLIDVHGDATERRIVSLIDREAARCNFVVVDLEAAASRLASRALARADLVLIPMQASTLDAEQAARAIGLVREEEELLRRRLPYRVLFTRTNPAVKTRLETRIVEELGRTGVPILSAHLHNRAAYQSLFTYRATLDGLDPALVNGVAAARDNAARLTAEVLEVLAHEAALAEEATRAAEEAAAAVARDALEQAAREAASAKSAAKRKVPAKAPARTRKAVALAA